MIEHLVSRCKTRPWSLCGCGGEGGVKYIFAFLHFPFGNWRSELLTEDFDFGFELVTPNPFRNCKMLDYSWSLRKWISWGRLKLRKLWKSPPPRTHLNWSCVSSYWRRFFHQNTFFTVFILFNNKMVNLIPCIFSGNFSCIFHQSEEVPCWRGRVSIYRSEVLPMAMASIRLWSYSATAKSTLLLNAALQKR